MNTPALRKELLVAIRDRRTQGQLSKRLGYDFNQLYRWESGKTQISWTDFVRVCRACKIPIETILKDCFSFVSPPDDFRGLVRHFIGKQSLESVARELSVTRHVLSRWLSGKSCPSLEKILDLIHFASADTFRFLEMLASPERLPSVQKEIELDRKQLEVQYRFPWLSAFLSAIDLEDYRSLPEHSNRFIQEKAKIRLKDVGETMDALIQAQILKKTGKHFETSLKRTGLRGSIEGRKRVAKFVNQRALDAAALKFGTPGTRTSWKIFSLNSKQAEKILQKYTQFFNEVGAIIDSGQAGADQVYILNMNLFNLEGLKDYEV